jgi:hypothetical protein
MTFEIENVQYEIIIASDPVRDGLGIELWTKDQDTMLAEIFRNDRLGTIQFFCVQVDLPFQVLEIFIAEFEKHVGREFQD